MTELIEYNWIIGTTIIPNTSGKSGKNKSSSSEGLENPYDSPSFAKRIRCEPTVQFDGAKPQSCEPTTDGIIPVVDGSDGDDDIVFVSATPATSSNRVYDALDEVFRMMDDIEKTINERIKARAITNLRPIFLDGANISFTHM